MACAITKRGDYMKLKIITAFYDRENDLKKREIGEIIEADKKRAETLIMRGLVEEVKEPAEKPKKPTVAKARAKTSK